MHDPDCPTCTDGTVYDRSPHRCSNTCAHPSECPTSDVRELPCACTYGRRFHVYINGKLVAKETSYAIAAGYLRDMPLGANGRIDTVDP